MKSRKKNIEGYVERKRDGTGLFIENGTNQTLHISRKGMRNVFDGDLVCIKKTKSTRRQTIKIEVLRVKKRKTKNILGTCFESRGKIYLRPIGRGYGRRIEIKWLGPPKFRNGDVVLCKLNEGPTVMDLSLSVAEVWGGIDDLEMESKVQIFKHDIQAEFPSDVKKIGKNLDANIIHKEVSNRRDLRECAFITIDGDDAKDFDDAVYCSSSGNDFVLRVAIADVSHFVEKGDAIDQTARERGSSIYFPRSVIPMLPTQLSDDLCSLKPLASRLVLVCEMKVDKNGSVKGWKFYLATIESKARLTYEQANQVLLNSNTLGISISQEVLKNLENLDMLFDAFNQAKLRRGALAFNSKETKCQFDENDKVSGLTQFDQLRSHRIIEECMLAANVCAAEMIGSKKNSSLFRVHGQPGKDKVLQLNRELRSLGVKVQMDLNPTPSAYRDLLNDIASQENSTLIEGLVIQSLERAYYATSTIGHFGLAYETYTHFTSPIRRYPDLICHRAIKAILVDKEIPKEDLLFLGTHLSERERVADIASREANNWCKYLFMKDKLGQNFTAVISAVREFGVFVTLKDYLVDGLIHISDLGRDYYYFDRDGCQIIGENLGQTFQLGATIRVRLTKVNVEMGEMDFIIDSY